MGKTHSKSETVHNADPQIRITNTQEYHTEVLDRHEFMMWCILSVVVVQLLITLYVLNKKREHKRALKFAKSLNDLNNVV